METLDVDETVGQLLAAEGFRSVEEIAFVETGELSNIQGLDEETGAEIQARAQDHLARIEQEHDDRRRELGVSDDLRELETITTPMMVALGENDVKSVEDLAGCATDDLVGYVEGRGPEAVRHAGFLDGFEVSRAEAEALIMAARVHAGWIEAPTESEEQADGEAEGEDAEGEAEPAEQQA